MSAKRTETRQPNTVDSLLTEDRFARILIENARDGILVADLEKHDTPIIWVNNAFEVLTGYSRSEALGKNCRYLQGGDHLQPEIAVMRSAIERREQVTVTLKNYSKTGRLFWNELTLIPIQDEGGDVSHYLGLMRDVTEVRIAHEKLSHSEASDPLTGLLNRDHFLASLTKIYKDPADILPIIKVDVAGLHQINLTFGYESGDELLRQLSARFVKLRPAAAARIGNNELAVGFVQSAAMSTGDIVERVTQVLKPAFALADSIVPISYALGYAVGSGDVTVSVLAQQAGEALHRSKTDPLRKPCIFDEAMQNRSRVMLRLTNELRQGIHEDDFLYHYQPQFDLGTGRVVGAEALIRWNHPLFGLQLPGSFLSVAEATGLILDIEKMGLPRVARFATATNRGRQTPINFSVNISSLEITRADLVGILNELLKQEDFDPRWMTLELTESLMTESSDHVLRVLRQVRQLGFGLSIDDFGTGYSSLSSLERFPISEVKIDQSFTRELGTSGVKRIVAEAVLALGQEMKIDVVAEGVETKEILGVLREMKCLTGQGYLFSRPIDQENFKKLLASDTVARDGTWL